MFSNEERTILQKNQLADVICQLRFPEILMISANPPALFQEAIRDTFPMYSVRKDTPAPKIIGAPGNFSVENQPGITNYQFASTDGVWRVNLTGTFISLACNRYNSWEEFAQRLDQPLAAFIKIYKPAQFQRLGLRYLNFISRKDLNLEDTPFSQLIDPIYLGPLGDEDVQERSVFRNSVDAEMAIRGGCRVKIHAGPGMVKRNGASDQEVRFIFDQDLYMTGNVPVSHSASALETLHSQAFPIFRRAITDTLYHAMDPLSI